MDFFICCASTKSAAADEGKPNGEPPLPSVINETAPVEVPEVGRLAGQKWLRQIKRNENPAVETENDNVDMNPSLGGGFDDALDMLDDDQKELQALQEAARKKKKIGCTVNPGPDEGLGSLEFNLSYDVHRAIFKVMIIRAKNLMAADLSGVSDPYVKISFQPPRLHRNKFATTICEATLKPVWNQTFVYKNFRNKELKQLVLRLDIYDYNRFHKHNSLGMVEFPLTKMYKRIVKPTRNRLDLVAREVLFKKHFLATKWTEQEDEDEGEDVPILEAFAANPLQPGAAESVTKSQKGSAIHEVGSAKEVTSVKLSQDGKAPSVQAASERSEHQPVIPPTGGGLDVPDIAPVSAKNEAGRSGNAQNGENLDTRPESSLKGSQTAKSVSFKSDTKLSIGPEGALDVRNGHGHLHLPPTDSSVKGKTISLPGERMSVGGAGATDANMKPRTQSLKAFGKAIYTSFRRATRLSDENADATEGAQPHNGIGNGMDETVPPAENGILAENVENTGLEENFSEHNSRAEGNGIGAEREEEQGEEGAEQVINDENYSGEEHQVGEDEGYSDSEENASWTSSAILGPKSLISGTDRTDDTQSLAEEVYNAAMKVGEMGLDSSESEDEILEFERPCIIRTLQCTRNIKPVPSMRPAYGQIQVAITFDPKKSNLLVQVVKAKRVFDPKGNPLSTFVLVTLYMIGRRRETQLKQCRTSLRMKVSRPVWNETFQFDADFEELRKLAVDIKVIDTSQLMKEKTLGMFRLGIKTSPTLRNHWETMIEREGLPVYIWQPIHI